jgi:DeoR family galactitol utilization operon repressor
MEQTEREQKILEALLEKDSITVSELSKRLGVSEVTIRTGLSSMEERGLLQRIHGGAVIGLHRGILQRQNHRVAEKQNIARAAAALVQNGDTIVIEAGTTPALVCRYLTARRDVHIVTNSNLAFQSAKNNPALKITLSGGEFRASTESFIGPVAIETIRRFNARFAFIGTDGFSAQNGITTNLLEGCEVIKAMKERAAQTIVLSDSTKYNKTGATSIMGLAGIDRLITDNEIPPGARRELAEAVNVTGIGVENRDNITIFTFEKGAA